MVLTYEQVERILQDIQGRVNKCVKSVSESYVEVVDYAEDGFIIFGVYHYAKDFDVITSIIDTIMKQNKLSYAVTYSTEQVDYRKNANEAK